MPHEDTYKVHLCKNGKEFHVIANVAASISPPQANEIIDEKWKVIGTLNSTAGEVFVDVEKLRTPHTEVTRSQTPA